MWKSINAAFAPSTQQTMAERKRKIPFSGHQLQVLTDEVLTHSLKLNARNLNVTERNCILVLIPQSVSVVVFSKHTFRLQKKMARFEEEDKGKIVTFNTSQASQMGGAMITGKPGCDNPYKSASVTTNSLKTPIILL